MSEWELDAGKNWIAACAVDVAAELHICPVVAQWETLDPQGGSGNHTLRVNLDSLERRYKFLRDTLENCTGDYVMQYDIRTFFQVLFSEAIHTA